jgi:hypothetical protein
MGATLHRVCCCYTNPTPWAGEVVTWANSGISGTGEDCPGYLSISRVMDAPDPSQLVMAISMSHRNCLPPPTDDSWRYPNGDDWTFPSYSVGFYVVIPGGAGVPTQVSFSASGEHNVHAYYIAAGTRGKQHTDYAWNATRTPSTLGTGGHPGGPPEGATLCDTIFTESKSDSHTWPADQHEAYGFSWRFLMEEGWYSEPPVPDLDWTVTVSFATL